MKEIVIANLTERLAAFTDLMSGLDEERLVRTIDVPKHKSIRDHLWCLVGARESYANALAADGWQGFSCSMEAFDLDAFEHHLDSSARQLMDTINSIDSIDWTEERETLLAALAEHEVMHEGQLIRHLYAIEVDPPESWRWA